MVRIAPHVDTVAAMYVMETGGHKVAPVPGTRVVVVVVAHTLPPP